MIDQLLPGILGLGGPGLAIAFLIWLWTQERKRADGERDRADAMTERMIEQSKKYLDDAARREASTLTHIEGITTYIKGRQG